MTRTVLGLTLATMLTASTASGQPNRLETTPGGKPGHPDDILVGPAKATISLKEMGRVVHKEVTLLFLTRSQVVYRETPHGPAFVRPAAEASRVATDDRKREWTCDEATKRYKGDAVPPKPLGADPRNLSPKEMAGYLVGRAETLHLELNNAISQRDEKRVESILEYAAAVRKLPDVPAGVSKLFDLAEFAKAQQKVQADLAREEAALRSKQAETDRERAAAQAAYSEQAASGLLQVFTGALVYDPYDFDARRVGAVLAGGGIRETAIAAAELRRQELFLAAHRARLNEAAVKVFADLNATYRAGQNALAGTVDAAWKELGVEPTTAKRVDALTGVLVGRQDTSAAVEVFDARLSHLRRLGLVAPDTALAVALLRAAELDGGKLYPTDRQQMSEAADKMLDLARGVVELSRVVPSDPLFDADRVRILTAAGKLAHRAAVMGHGPKGWSACYDPRADYGLRVLDTAIGYGRPLDAAGEARAVRAALLFQRGLKQDALVQGEEVARMREWDAGTMFNMARFHAQNSPTRGESVVYYEKALKAGFRSLRLADADPDLGPMWTTKSDLWKQMNETEKCDVIVQYSPTPGKQGFRTGDIEIKNKTRYPLTNVEVQFSGRPPRVFGQPPPQPELSAKFKIEYIAPEGVHVIPGVVTTNKVYTEAGLKITVPVKGRTATQFAPAKAAAVNLFRGFWGYN